jgi:hypothetical protein
MAVDQLPFIGGEPPCGKNNGVGQRDHSDVANAHGDIEQRQ